ncbi:hypothetical protein ROD_17251 [Citrobacter rodentium ICC168]|uniref:Uncharacterized protein n=1 Tax=Citrobacter rodentium (strain ICC168) TaxID=637910 RepID=D2TL35_CITRI|nr:hypothetical protein ROD_17251 [Citrobacter rodentium ICC168]
MRLFNTGIKQKVGVAYDYCKYEILVVDGGVLTFAALLG